MTFGTALPTGFLPISSGNSVNFAVMVSASGVQSMGNLIISSSGFVMVEMIQSLKIQSSTVIGGYVASCAVTNGGLIPSRSTIGFTNDIYVSYLCV